MRVTCSRCAHVREGFCEQPSNALTMPNPGDFWLCPKCGELHRFTDRFVVGGPALSRIAEFFVRPAADEELEQLEESLRSSLRRQRDQIRAPASEKA
jgi:hypothetical protein